MGITIFASGKIDRTGDIPNLIDDVRGIAQENNWTFRVIDEDFAVKPDAAIAPRESGVPVCRIEGSAGLKGIILNIDPKSEPFFLLFDKSGVLTDLMRQVPWIESNGQDERLTACKTQFGKIDSHIRIIELLDRLKKKYITDLAVTDEGAYWESRDPRILAEKRVELGHYIRHTERVISSIETSDDDARDTETLASRIEEALLKEEEDDGLPR